MLHVFHLIYITRNKDFHEQHNGTGQKISDQMNSVHYDVNQEQYLQATFWFVEETITGSLTESGR
jgi:hypothetical protein